jgi:hypothetical protein
MTGRVFRRHAGCNERLPNRPRGQSHQRRRLHPDALGALRLCRAPQDDTIDLQAIRRPDRHNPEVGIIQLFVRRQWRGGNREAAIYSLLGSAKLNGRDPEAFMREVIAHIADLPITRIKELPFWNLKATQTIPLTDNNATPEVRDEHALCSEHP